ncbi:MAG TPA: DUF3800 domain-containing protein [Solirubrobacterales bacterium]|nr:DUF3800 domain-containing protein [Solirubrobacterales bacterium]
MRFGYMDEAGNTGRRCDDPHQPIHLILTLVVDEAKVALLHEYVREMAQKHCPKDCEEYGFEFHGQDLFSGRGNFESRMPAERIQIFDDLLKGIEITEAEIIIRGVDKVGLQRRKYPTRFHPHDIALMFTIESVERMARDHDCRVLLIADEAKEIEHAAIRDLASYQQMGTNWGFRTEQINRIIDTIHFVPSHTNCAIQLADCATFVAARMRKIRDGLVVRNESAEAVERLWEARIEPHIHANEVWYPTP